MRTSSSGNWKWKRARTRCNNTTSDTFTFTRVKNKAGTTINTTYTILDDSSYGGLTFGYAGLGKAAPFRAVLPNFDGSLNDATSGTGVLIRTRDEIKITSSATYGVTYTGIVTNVEVPVKPHNERVVIVSGIDFYNFWAPRRKREVDYRLNPTIANTVVKDALNILHPDIYALSGTNINSFTTTVFKDWKACHCRDIIQECCQAVGAEFFVDGAKIPYMFAAGSLSLGRAITEADLANETGTLVYSADDAEYDELIITSNNPLFAPNSVSPTGISYTTDPSWWQTSTTPTITGVVAGSQLETTTKASSSEVFMIGGTYPAILGSSTASSLAMGIRPPFSGSSIFSSGGTVGRLGLVEADWDHFNFAVQFDFNNLTSFKVRLSEANGPGQGASSYWESAELLPIPTAATQPTLFRLAMPSVVAASPSDYSWTWTTSGVPVNVDMVFFYFQGSGALSSNFDKKAFVTYAYFEAVGNKTSTVASPPTPKAQKIIIDRTLQNETDIQNLVTNERTKLDDAAFMGQLTLTGDPGYLYNTGPGWNATITLTHLNPNNITARIDSVTHRVIDGEWTTTIDFAPSLVASPLYNRLAQVALRRNEEDDDNLGFAFGVDNLA